MDGLCSFYAEREVPFTRNLFPFRPNSAVMNVSEIFFNGTEKSHDVCPKSVPHAEIEDWLAMDQTATSCGQGRAPLFRMVWIERRKEFNAWSYGIRKQDLEKILRSFHIERAFQYGYTGESGIADFPDEHGDTNIHTHSVFVSNFFGVAWSYNAELGIRAVCWGDPWILIQMQRVLVHQKALCGHPTTLELFAAIVLEEWIDRDLLGKINEVRSVEIRTGYHDWRVLEKPPAKGGYAVLSARMSGCAAALAGLRRISGVTDQIIQCHSRFPKYQNVYTKNSSSSENHALTTAMEQCEDILRRRLAMQNVQIDFLLERTRIQQTALFNLIAQRDAKLNIALAKDSRTLATASKQDSSSMKTLAALTVTFLPATFVASLFSMPLFNWDAEQSTQVVKNRFGVYWAVTIPLTITTLVIWLSWTHRQTLIRRAQDKKDRDELVLDVSGTDGEILDDDFFRYSVPGQGPAASFGKKEDR